jgi:DNA mismatch repair protein PMS2
LQTFGFRGEALSSLCALSHFSVTTCLAADAPRGTKLEFETSGKLKGTSIVAAQKGTTVTVENLFSTLPVRRRELERNIKREWTRVVGLLGQYACISTGVKLSVAHQPLKGKKTILFSTKGNATTKENIVNVFGAKTLSALLKLELKLELEATRKTKGVPTDDNIGAHEVLVRGHVSRPAWGEGRQTPDRQMFFVNGRPCGLPQFAKAFNEVYKSYNSHQSPFICANIELDTHLYDVNVSPDKRTILLHDQDQMLEKLKESLSELFDNQAHTVPVSQLPTQKLPLYKQLTISESARPDNKASQSTDATQDRESSSDEETSHTEEKHEAVNGAPRRAATDGPLNSVNGLDSSQTSDTEVPGRQSEDDDTITQRGESQEHSDRRVRSPEQSIPVVISPTRRPYAATGTISQYLKAHRRASPTIATITIGDHTTTSPVGTPVKRQRVERSVKDARVRVPLPSFGSRLSQRFAASTNKETELSSCEEDEVESDEQWDEEEIEVENEAEVSNDETENDDKAMANEQDDEEDDLDHVETGEPGEEPLVTTEDSLIQVQSTDAESNPEPTVPAPTAEVPTSSVLDEEQKKAQEDAKVLEMIAAAEEASRPSEDNEKRTRLLMKGNSRKNDSTLQLVQALETSLAKVSAGLRSLDQALAKHRSENPNESATGTIDDADAEERLSLTVSKGDFAKMKVIGQFNLGFILAVRNGTANSSDTATEFANDELFIIDQHASDEKYNFERLQAVTAVQSQRLVVPKRLNLSAVEEEVVIENQEALELNGFKVEVDESGDSPVGQRCQVVNLPVSRETTFSISDLEELIALLTEQPSGSAPRPSKVRKMFAMRACRSSVMIGKTLTHQQMSKLVRHMGEIDKPWNCPHGRPTMRHLCNLDSWDESGRRETHSSSDTRPAFTGWADYVRQKKALAT